MTMPQLGECLLRIPPLAFTFNFLDYTEDEEEACPVPHPSKLKKKEPKPAPAKKIKKKKEKPKAESEEDTPQAGASSSTDGTPPEVANAPKTGKELFEQDTPQEALPTQQLNTDEQDCFDELPTTAHEESTPEEQPAASSSLSSPASFEAPNTYINAKYKYAWRVRAWEPLTNQALLDAYNNEFQTTSTMDDVHYHVFSAKVDKYLAANIPERRRKSKNDPSLSYFTRYTLGEVRYDNEPDNPYDAVFKISYSTNKPRIIFHREMKLLTPKQAKRIRSNIDISDNEKDIAAIVSVKRNQRIVERTQNAIEHNPDTYRKTNKWVHYIRDDKLQADIYLYRIFENDGAGKA